MKLIQNIYVAQQGSAGTYEKYKDNSINGFMIETTSTLNIEFSTKSNRDKNTEEVEKAIKGYSTALKSGDLTEIKKYIIIPTKTNQDRLEKHFKALSEEPIPEVTAKGIKVISDMFAIVQIEVKHEHFSLTQNHAVGKENGQWKVVFGSTLTNSAIPLSDKSIEIN
ncbi:hypothetical protein [Bacillus massilinigeriensis]|uniref:hypothetical protein n=1 Tax=Bacillus massilionigeriensis TaxID=1805475 RepID=UPI00096B182A|nr:hypothetical protein [Bacillus massilionigeriensis]